MSGRTFALALLGVLAAACAASRPTASPPLPPAPTPVAGSCPALAGVASEEAACARDGTVQALQARFRAEVVAGNDTRTAEGVLVWRAPGALRVKLFTLAGITVYDALWVGDRDRLRGVVRQPLSGDDATYDLAPGELPDAPDADLSLVLWSLWQPRCTRPPAAADGELRLDAATARAAQRSVRVENGLIVEETLLRERAGGRAERVVARYGGYDCLAPPLPREVAIDAPDAGWRARVTIIEQQRDPVVDDALFALPAGGDGGR